MSPHDEGQGRGNEESLRASQEALGITGNPMESRTVRLLCVLMVVIAVAAVLQKLGVL